MLKLWKVLKLRVENNIAIIGNIENKGNCRIYSNFLIKYKIRIWYNICSKDKTRTELKSLISNVEIKTVFYTQSGAVPFFFLRTEMKSHQLPIRRLLSSRLLCYPAIFPTPARRSFVNYRCGSDTILCLLKIISYSNWAVASTPYSDEKRRSVVLRWNSTTN